MIHCKLGSLFNLTDAVGESTLFRLMNIGKEISLISNRWKISVVVEGISKALSVAMTPRTEILEKYGQPSGDNQWVISKENLPSYQKEIDLLRNEEIEISGNPLDLEIFEGSNLTVQDLILLDAAGLLVKK